MGIVVHSELRVGVVAASGGVLCHGVRLQADRLVVFLPGDRSAGAASSSGGGDPHVVMLPW